ncbi:hypothetical protein HW278_08040 [Capnocytophaga sp. oral taxon 902]|jgi:hypothetical protein|uniref:Uncharacterized protein n=1 Tax=Capnocytophaga ochracea TaxID=1018 RepID=A0AA46ZTG7_CAPOC|nr:MULTISPECIES: hypothetical protein [Capnocytophaga]QLF50655.1 hypothetical protein HW278_08040 [Capnocytophaga sp. oral taxon 902]UZD41922.1 hypothetical protein OL231_05080 [Capnocytophaga ochracea]
MEVKLNKELQKKLDAFLESKDTKLHKLLEILNLKEFTFSEEEINQIEKIYKKNQDLYDYTYVYIGEAVIKILGGFWSIGKFKKDEAYGYPIILAWGGNDYNPRICPDIWLKRIGTDRLRTSLGKMIYS